MAKIETYACDVCQIQKQPSNNWWKVYEIESDYTPERKMGVLILEWDCTTPSKPKELGEGFTADRATAHICGSKCLFEWISKNLLEKGLCKSELQDRL